MEKKTVILIVGMGKSGVAAMKLALKQGYRVDIYDKKDPSQNSLLQQNTDFLKQVRSVYFNEMPQEVDYDLIVVSPGVNPHTREFEEWEKRGAKIISEVEFAYQNSHGEFIGITGTNGKTTTTSLCFEMFQHEFHDRVRIVGNVGIPISEEILDEIEKEAFDRIYICELSSYQLEYIDRFKSEIAAILNITPDHLERHSTMRGYIDAKLRIIKNSDFTQNDKLILNADDEILSSLELDPSDVIYVSTQTQDAHYHLKEGSLCYRLGEESVQILPTEQLHLFGNHNYSNALFASAIALEYGVPLAQVQRALREFLPIEHRMEFVREFEGIKFYNDSKATNPEASIPALLAMCNDTILIAGGSDKKSDYSEWISHFQKIKKAILIGDTAADIAKAMERANNPAYEFQPDMQHAVDRALAICRSDREIRAVLLSPACASFDQYQNYEHRGRHFKQIVKDLSSENTDKR